MRYNIKGQKDSEVKKLRDKWLRKGYDLINITTLCTAEIGNSGWCNGLNEPDETIHHIKVLYREEQIAVIGNKPYVLDEDKYLLFITGEDDVTGFGFIIFKKCKT